MNKLHIYFNLIAAIICSPIYILHLLAYCFKRDARHFVNSDIDKYKHNCQITDVTILLVLYFIHNDPAFRSLFYHRLGVTGYLIKWIRPGMKSLHISRSMKIGEGCYLAHPEATILTAKSIGKNFTCIQLTTLGKEKGLNPIIGDNVTLGANVSIIGGVTIGNNVTIGAGSVVIKDIPDNCIAVGVPAKVIKNIE